jgi:hypothetical protein
MKTIDLVCSSTPDKPEFGWGDHIDVYDGTTPIYGCSASCCPNPYRVSSRGSPIPWQLCYGWIAEGEYDYVCVDKGLLLDDGGVVPSMGGLDHLSNVFVRSGATKKGRPDWRCSQGDITIPPADWSIFFALFRLGEHGRIRIRPYWACEYLQTRKFYLQESYFYVGS